MGFQGGLPNHPLPSKMLFTSSAVGLAVWKVVEGSALFRGKLWREQKEAKRGTVYRGREIGFKGGGSPALSSAKLLKSVCAKSCVENGLPVKPCLEENHTPFPTFFPPHSHRSVSSRPKESHSHLPLLSVAPHRPAACYISLFTLTSGPGPGTSTHRFLVGLLDHCLYIHDQEHTLTLFQL
jgi:hypothetical protein